MFVFVVFLFEESLAAPNVGQPPSAPVAGNSIASSMAVATTAVKTCTTTSVGCGNVIPQPTIVSDSTSNSPYQSCNLLLSSLLS